MRSGADAICQSLGGAPTFRAYLASVSENAITRLPNGARGFVRADGRPFKTRLEPTSPTFYPPNLDQTGAVVSGVVSSTLWTGADRFGAGSSQRSCGDWTSGQVNLGLFDSGATGWTAFGQNTCASTARHHLLCLETAYRADVAPSAPPANARLVFVTRGTFDPQSGVDGADALCESEAATHLPGTYRAIPRDDDVEPGVAVHGATRSDLSARRHVPLRESRRLLHERCISPRDGQHGRTERRGRVARRARCGRRERAQHDDDELLVRSRRELVDDERERPPRRVDESNAVDDGRVLPVYVARARALHAGVSAGSRGVRSTIRASRRARTCST